MRASASLWQTCSDTVLQRRVAIEVAGLAVWGEAPRRTKLTDEQVPFFLSAPVSALPLDLGTIGLCQMFRFTNSAERVEPLKHGGTLYRPHRPYIIPQIPLLLFFPSIISIFVPDYNGLKTIRTATLDFILRPTSSFKCEQYTGVYCFALTIRMSQSYDGVQRPTVHTFFWLNST